jgi:hypothetical protein
LSGYQRSNWRTGSLTASKHEEPSEHGQKLPDYEGRRSLNIRISSRDLKNLQARALEEGIPYQTLAASLLHKYVSGQLVEQR